MADEFEDLDLENEELEDQEESEDQEELGDRGDSFESDEEDSDSEDSSDIGEEEEQEEEAPHEEKEAKKSSLKVPKSRLDEVIAQREEARRQIDEANSRSQWLEEQLEKLINQQTKKETVQEPTAPTFNFDEAEEKYIDLVIAGEVAKAAKLRGEINSARHKETLVMIEQIKNSATTEAKEQSTKAIEDRAFGTLILNIESKYKFLDSKSSFYNEEAVDTVNALLKGYVASGQSKSEALKKAVSKVVPMYVKEVPVSKPSLGKERTTEAGKKAAAASKSQPVTTSSKATSTKPPVTTVKGLSDSQFAALTEREKKVLRGD